MGNEEHHKMKKTYVVYTYTETGANPCVVKDVTQFGTGFLGEQECLMLWTANGTYRIPFDNISFLSEYTQPETTTP